jgi:hypothetical protein
MFRTALDSRLRGNDKSKEYSEAWLAKFFALT